MKVWRFLRAKMAVGNGDVAAVPINDILDGEIILSNGIRVSFFEEQKKHLPVGIGENGDCIYIRDDRLRFWLVMDRGKPSGVYICSGPEGFSAKGIVTGREERCLSWSGVGYLGGFLCHLMTTDFFIEETCLNNSTNR